MTQFAELFRERRETQGLTRQQVVEKTPYRNVEKGTQRLKALEEGYWTPDKKVVAWFAEALAIPMDDVRQARNADWNQVEKHITIRLPADDCGVCGNTLDEIGGRRLLTTISRALLIKGVQTNWCGRWRQLCAVRLDDPYSQLYVIMAGFKAADEVMERAQPSPGRSDPLVLPAVCGPRVSAMRVAVQGRSRIDLP